MTRSPLRAIRVGANIRIISESSIILNYLFAKVMCFSSSQPQIKPIFGNRGTFVTIGIREDNNTKD